MKFFLLVLILGCVQSGLFGQGNQWDWAVRATGVHSELSRAVATDLNGNIYITGKYESPVLLLGSTLYINQGGDDFFLAKYSPNGDVLWAKSFGGPGWEESFAITLDPDGNVLVTGLFNSTSFLIGGTTLTNNGNLDIFLAKFDPDGKFIWATSAGGTSFEAGLGIVTDGKGNVYITGSFFSSQLTFGTTTLDNSGNIDIFLAKYDGAGNPIWAKSYGGFDDEEGLGITSDLAGNIVLTGYFESTQIIFGNDTLINAGERDIFICKHDPSGQLLWIRSSGGTGDDIGVSVAVNESDAIIVAGMFGSSSLTWDTFVLTNTSGFSTNMFAVQMDGDGHVEWANSGKSNQGNEARSIATDIMGNVYITGIYLNKITFDTNTLTSKGNYDVFTIAYDSLGNVVQASSIGGDGADQSFGIAADPESNIYITGNFDSKNCSFGPLTISNTGEFDLFLAKWKNETSPVFNISDASLSIKLFPNPSRSDVFFHSEVQLHEATLTLYDAQGKIVTNMTGIDGQSFLLPRYQIPGGTYFFQVTQANLPLATSKLVFIDE